ncbi:hypothetical protein TIFTF001_033039 [Ficus carica]|uniref:Uncharacterized protein n=1 Tax=Ficus carica TaxID=3494 RepID=A0AA88E196_FICCA|nr:hypothetical protein TIFTF001_033039 [Ficus carica]
MARQMLVFATPGRRLVFATPGFHDDGQRLVSRRLGFATTRAEDGFTSAYVFGFSQWQAFVVGEMGELRRSWNRSGLVGNEPMGWRI